MTKINLNQDFVIDNILGSISDDELAVALDELANKDAKGIPSDGVIAKYSYDLTTIAGIDINYVESFLESYLHKLAATKWVQLHKLRALVS